MKCALFIFLLLFMFPKMYSQIRLPRGFVGVRSSENFRSDNSKYYSDGTFRFYLNNYRREADTPEEFIETMKSIYKFQIKKTLDNLYWGSGYQDGKFYYVILIPENETYLFVNSPADNKEFSNHSVWLLKQVRNLRNKNLHIYFTDCNGN